MWTEARLLNHPTPTTKIHESPLSKEIKGHEFLKKFSTLTFDYYFGVSDPIHVRHFRDKVIYSRNDPVMCLTFPPSLKGVASDQ